MTDVKRNRFEDSRTHTSSSVVIDGRFLRDTARDAVVQFFVPLTAAFTLRHSPEQKGPRRG